MTNADISQSPPASPFKSELARFCLPAARREANRKLAWTNSICVLFLIIGLVGAKNAPIGLKAPPPVEEPVATVLEPTPPPPSSDREQPKEEQSEEDKSDAPRVVVVTPESPAINFSVPTIGNLVVPNALAEAPSLKPLKSPATVRKAPVLLNNTGEGGDRPRPPYPRLALESVQQGTVILSIMADDAGRPISVVVKETSGYPALDRGTSDFVKKHWILPPGSAGRFFEATFIYKIDLNSLYR